jgi:hypothetical protein
MMTELHSFCVACDLCKREITIHTVGHLGDRHQPSLGWKVFCKVGAGGTIYAHVCPDCNSKDLGDEYEQCDC